MTTSDLVRALGRSGALLLRYGLVLVIAWIGLFKFTPTEAAGIEPLLRHSPLLSWLYLVMGVRGASNLIGGLELAIALLIALRPWAPRLAAAGSLGAVAMFVTTLSFIFSTPGSFRVIDGIFVPAGLGQFLLKDLVLLGAALWCAGEALAAVVPLRPAPASPRPAPRAPHGPAVPG